MPSDSPALVVEGRAWKDGPACHMIASSCEIHVQYICTVQVGQSVMQFQCDTDFSVGVRPMCRDNVGS